MKPFIWLLLMSAALFVVIACRKNTIENNPPENKPIANNPPIANAGSDTLMITPVENIQIDGSGSYDPDPGDTITSYKWSLVSGDPLSMINESTEKCIIQLMPRGEYTFKLTVTDKAGLSSSDQVKITAYDPTIFNRTKMYEELVWQYDSTANLMFMESPVLEGRYSTDAVLSVSIYSYLPEIPLINWPGGYTRIPIREDKPEDRYYYHKASDKILVYTSSFHPVYHTVAFVQNKMQVIFKL